MNGHFEKHILIKVNFKTLKKIAGEFILLLDFAPNKF